MGKKSLLRSSNFRAERREAAQFTDRWPELLSTKESRREEKLKLVFGGREPPRRVSFRMSRIEQKMQLESGFCEKTRTRLEKPQLTELDLTTKIIDDDRAPRTSGRSIAARIQFHHGGRVKFPSLMKNFLFRG